MGTVGRELLREDDVLRIYWDVGSKCVELEAKGDASSAQFRAGLEMVLVLVKDKRSRKLLADVGKVGKITGEDMVWTETDWAQRLAKTDVKFFAIVMPKSLGLHMSIDKMSERVDPKTVGQVRRFFPDADTARKWLTQQ